MASYVAYGISVLFNDISDPCDSPEEFKKKYLEGTMVECYSMYNDGGSQDCNGYILAIPSEHFRDFASEEDMREHLLGAIGPLCFGGMTMEDMERECYGFDRSDIKHVYEVTFMTTVCVVASDKSAAEDDAWDELQAYAESLGLPDAFEIDKIEEERV